MKILLDSCLSRQAIELIRQAGHEVEWTGDWPTDPGDEQILKHASTTSQILVTIDKDFGELAVAKGLAQTGIIRLVGFRAQDQGSSVVRLLAKYEAELAAGAILTAEPWRVRVRPR